MSLVMLPYPVLLTHQPEHSGPANLRGRRPCPQPPPSLPPPTPLQVAALQQQLGDMALQLERKDADIVRMRAEAVSREIDAAAAEETLRSESSQSIQALCDQFDEESTAYRLRASIKRQGAESATRAAVVREMRSHRCLIEGASGLVLVCGPPCAGKSARAEALAAQLGATHAALPSLIADVYAGAEPSAEAAPRQTLG